MNHMLSRSMVMRMDPSVIFGGFSGFAFATELSVVSLDQGPLRCGLPLRCTASFADVTRMWEASDWYHLTR
jgi:hypothetical protein